MPYHTYLKKKKVMVKSLNINLCIYWKKQKSSVNTSLLSTDFSVTTAVFFPSDSLGFGQCHTSPWSVPGLCVIFLAGWAD